MKRRPVRDTSRAAHAALAHRPPPNAHRITDKMLCCTPEYAYVPSGGPCFRGGRCSGQVFPEGPAARDVLRGWALGRALVRRTGQDGFYAAGSGSSDGAHSLQAATLRNGSRRWPHEVDQPARLQAAAKHKVDVIFRVVRPTYPFKWMGFTQLPPSPHPFLSRSSLVLQP